MFIKDKEFLKYVFELAQECKNDFNKFCEFAGVYNIPTSEALNDVLDSDFVEVLLELQNACVTNNDAKIMDCAKTIDYLNTIKHIKKYEN